MQLSIKKGTDGAEYIAFKFRHSKALADKCTFLGLKYSPRYDLYWGPLTKASSHRFIQAFPKLEKSFPRRFRAEKVPAVTPTYDTPVPDYLMPHQKEGVLLSDKHSHHLFAFDTGTGKTATAIEIHRRKRVKTIVCCPLSIIEAAWVEDIKKFAPELRVANLWKLYSKYRTTKGKRDYERAIKEADICIINFEGVKSQLRHLGQGNFRMLLVDESSKLKNPKSKITKMLTNYSEDMDYVYLFSGTPAPNSLLEYYPQVRMLDRDLLGKNFYVFRNRYFRQVGYGGFKWIVDFEKEDTLLEKLSEVVTVKSKEDVLENLPERTDNVVSVNLSKEESKAYKEMCDHLITQINDEVITSANAAVKLMKLREITSGFLLDENNAVQEIGSSKFKILTELLEEIGVHQVIIWTQFVHEATTIEKTLLKLGKTVGVVNGSVNQSTKDNNIKRFKDGTDQYIIAHPRSMAHGVTLTNCNYCVYFNMSYSFEEIYQSKDRIYRYGQANACSYYYLLARGTVDEVVYRAVSAKHSAAQEVLNFLKGEQK